MALLLVTGSYLDDIRGIVTFDTARILSKQTLYTEQDNKNAKERDDTFHSKKGQIRSISETDLKL